MLTCQFHPFPHGSKSDTKHTLLLSIVAAASPKGLRSKIEIVLS